MRTSVVRPVRPPSLSGFCVANRWKFPIGTYKIHLLHHYKEIIGSSSIIRLVQVRIFSCIETNVLVFFRLNSPLSFVRSSLVISGFSSRINCNCTPTWGSIIRYRMDIHNSNKVPTIVTRELTSRLIASVNVVVVSTGSSFTSVKSSPLSHRDLNLSISCRSFRDIVDISNFYRQCRSHVGSMFSSFSFKNE